MLVAWTGAAERLWVRWAWVCGSCVCWTSIEPRLGPREWGQLLCDPARLVCVVGSTGVALLWRLWVCRPVAQVKVCLVLVWEACCSCRLPGDQDPHASDAGHVAVATAL